ncbi:MAG: Rv3235 family protein [Nitriliruptoraceae bacterium]
MSVTTAHPEVSAAARRQLPRQPSRRRPAKPDPARLAELVVATWLEVRAGRRPLSQIRALFAPALYRQLCGQLEPVRSGVVLPSRIRSVFSCSPTPATFEASVLVEQPQRVTAIAVRIERHQGVWRVVEMTAPEAGLRPLGTALADIDDDQPTPRLSA